MRPVFRDPLKCRTTLIHASVLLSLIGCAAGVGLSNMWRDPSYPSAPIRTVFVIAVKRDPALRRLTEDAFVSAFAKHGVSATPSYRQFPGALPDTDTVSEAVRQGGYDAVLVASKLDTRTVETYVPGYITTEAHTHWNPWLGQYQTYYRDVQTPGYVETDAVVRHRVELWATQDGRMVWTATGSSVNPNSADQLNRQLAGRVADELVKQGIIPK
jgi:hypothetical protein